MDFMKKRSWRTELWPLHILVLLCACGLSSQAASGRPIVVLTNAANLFSQYHGEILSTEGLNEFAKADVTSISSATLAPYDVAILGQATLSSAQVTTLSNWVNQGGKLIAMRPDKQLAGLLGLVDAGSTLSEGYLLVNTSNGPGVGIVDQTMQFHGTADRYTLAGASSLATLYSNALTATANPAVTLRSVGSNGGQAAAFTFDLARSIVCTRQGNPAWSGQERDGQTPIRSDDLFYGAASFDPQPDYVDLNKVAIPQADEQQRLLANMILSMESDKKLLPRFWYFPNGYKAVVVMTGDDHANGGTAGRFDQYMAYSPTNASVDDWQAIRGTSYIFPNTPLTNLQASNYNAAGFEICLHLNTGCADYTPDSLHTMFTNQLSQFTNAFRSLPPMLTHRTHCIAWSSYTALPEEESRLGIRLDTSYYYWPPLWVTNRPGLFTGSGMAMRFAKTNGALIDVFQAATQMTDESDQTFPYTVDTLLDRALGPEGYYGAFVANMHTDYENSPGSDAIVNSAMSRGVPVITARQLLTWLDARNGSTFDSVIWTNNAMNFTITASASARGLQGMMPIPAGYEVTNITRNGVPIGYTLSEIKGIQYAFFAATNGNYSISIVPDTTAPTITAIVPQTGATGVKWMPDVSVTFSEAMAEATISPSTIILRDASNNTVSASVSYNPSTLATILTPTILLTPSTTYTATVKGGVGGVTDLIGNPLTSDFVWSFTTADQIGIWDNSAQPAVLQDPDVGSIELGMKFQSAVAGNIMGIRFYRGLTNAGPHTGSLWTGAGTLLASVTFMNETASGWQYQALTNPVAINSNTTYVVSYHAPAGRYSVNSHYFAQSATNYPLRALADGENGGNGLYRYGTSAFPNLTYNSENYWVDVAFRPGALALAITTSSLPGGTISASYSTTLTAIGGTSPYTWSIASGSLPPGLALNTSSGAIAGTPTSSGTFNFIAQVGDASNPTQTATQSLSITIIAGPPAIIGNTNNGTSTDGLWDTSAYINASRFQATTNITVSTIEAKVTAISGKYKCAIYTDSGSQPSRLMGSTVEVSNPNDGWQAFPLTASLVLTNGSYYWLAIWSDNSGAKVYYSDNAGTLRWGQYNYGAWPDPISASSGGTLNYCIYAFGSAGLTAANLGVNMLEDTSTNLTLIGQSGQGAVTFGILTNPTNGVLGTLNTNTGAVTYQPNSNYSGPDFFRYRVSDGSLLATGTVSITVTPVNDAPIAFSQSLTNAEDTALAIALTASDVDGPVTNFVVTGNPAHGTLSGTAPNLTYAPVTNYFGSDSLSFRVNDGSLTSAVATVSITLTNVNDAPIAFSQSLTNAEDSAFAITLTASDVDGPVTNFVVTGNPAHGTLSGTAPNLTYAPVTNYFGSDSLSFRVNDGSLTSAVATVSITLTNVNDAPIAFSQSLTNAEDSAFAITLTASDVDGPVTNFVVTGNPAHGTLSGTAPNLTYAPVTNYFGSDSLSFRVNDGSLTSAVATVSITLTNVNDAPIAFSQSLTNAEDSAFAITLTASDVDGPVTNFVVTGNPAHGTLSGTAPNLTYAPVTNYFGSDSLSFRVNDGSLTSAVATVSITLTNVNDAPILPVQIDITVDELTLLTVTNTAADPDSAPELLIYTVTVTNLLDSSEVTNASISTNGVISWTPTEAQGPGTNRFTTVVSDGSLNATNSFLVVVNEINSAPVLPAQTDRSLDVWNTLVVTNTASDSDLPANTLTYELQSAPGGALIDANGLITWTPLSAQGDSTNLFTTVVVDDGLPPLSTTNTFLVWVSAAPIIPGPVITSISLSDSDVILTWTSVPLGIYRLQYIEDLSTTNWTDVLPDVTAAGSISTVTNQSGATTQRFYRLLVVPLP